MVVGFMYSHRLGVRSSVPCMDIASIYGGRYSRRLSVWSSASCTVVSSMYSSRLHARSSAACTVVAQLCQACCHHMKFQVPTVEVKILRSSCGSSVRPPRPMNWHSTTCTLCLITRAKSTLREQIGHCLKRRKFSTFLGCQEFDRVECLSEQACFHGCVQNRLRYL